jgi:hypothetical protein
MQRLIIGTILALVAGAATAKDLKITPTPGDGQSLAYVQGHAALISQKPRGIVALVLDADRIPEKSQVRLVLGVENKSGSAVNFTTANISPSTDAGPTKVLSASDLQAEVRAAVKKQLFWAKVGAVGAAMSAASATDEPGTFDSTTTYFGRSASTSGTYTAPVSGEAERARAERNGAIFAARAQEARDSQPGREAAAAEDGFKPVTLAAGAHRLGPMPLSRLPAKATKLSIVVELNGETHVFTFGVAPAS